jgi:hypothetical protein
MDQCTSTVAGDILWQMDERREPVELEVITFLDNWALLVQSVPSSRIAFGGFHHLGRKPFGPQPLARLTPQRIAGLRLHRKLDDAPLVRFAVEQSAAEIILVPSGHDDNLARAWFQTREEIIDVPLPGGLASAFAIGILAATHRVIDDPEIGTPAGDRSPNTSRVIFSGGFGLPLSDRFAVRSDPNAEDVPVRLRGNEIADSSPESLGKFLGMRGRYYRTLWMPAEIPGWKEHTRIGRLRAAGRHVDHQPRAVAALDLFEVTNQ